MQVQLFSDNLNKNYATSKSFAQNSKVVKSNNLRGLLVADIYTPSFKGDDQDSLFNNLGVNIHDLIARSQRPENILGEGANSIVYKIPELNDYVLKVLHNEGMNRVNIGEFPSDVNLGQPVWQDKENSRYLILKKVEGDVHSIDNWSKTIWDKEKYTPLPVTKVQANLYYEQLSDLANMPQAAYNQLVRNVKILDERGYKLDSINPNNLIVDKEKSQIHIIDSFKVKPHERDIYKNCYMDLVAIMLDFTLFPEFFDKMDDKKKVSTLYNVKLIQEKVYKAAQNSDLSLDVERFKTFIKAISRWFPAHSVPNENNGGIYFRYYDVRMLDFLDMLENPIRWAAER